MDSQQCIKILPPDNKHAQIRRCGCNTSLQDLEQSRRLSAELEGQTAEENIMKRIILLRVCKNSHRAKLEQSETLGRLIKEYKSKLPKPETTKLQLIQKGETLFERFEPSRRGSSVLDILKQAINPIQDLWGPLYIFSWPRQPGFLKIGYAKKSAGERVDNWQLCHPEATLVYEVEVPFPERMETLVHAELAGRRYRLREGCSRCAAKHQEWFAITLDEAQGVISAWSEVAASQLYTKDRTLSLEWSRIIRTLPQVTAFALSQQLGKYPFSNTSRIGHVSGQPRTASSPGTPNQREHLVASPSPFLQPQKDTRIDEIVAKLDHVLTFKR